MKPGAQVGAEAFDKLAAKKSGDPSYFVVEDLDSLNGTKFKDKKYKGSSFQLRLGETFSIGKDRSKA